MVLLVMNHLQDGRHSLDRNCLLLGTLHGDLTMLDTVGFHERQECLGHLLIHESPKHAVSANLGRKGLEMTRAYTMVFRPSF